MTLTKTQTDALISLAGRNGWKLNTSFLHKSQIIFQTPGMPYAELIYRPTEKGRFRSDLRDRRNGPILQEVIRIVNQK